MAKPNISKSISNLLETYWTLDGDLARQNIDFLADERETTKLNCPTILCVKGREYDHEEGLPKGVVTWVEHEIYATPMMPTEVSGATDKIWDMKREIQRIVRAYRTSASGIERMWLAQRSPRTSDARDPYRGSEVVIICWWRET